MTAEDYKALISNNNTLANIGSVSVWGGEDNEIVDYGKVYISIKPADNVSETLTELEKENVLRFLKDKKVISILPKLVDPDFLYIYFDLFFKFDSSKTTLSKEGLVINVKDTISNFNNSFLNNFDGIYRHSNFLSTIDNSLPAILNTTARVYLYKKLVINVVDGVSTNKSVDFKTALDGKVDQTESMISSSIWTYNNKRVQLADEKIVGSQTKRNVFMFSSLPDGNNEIIFKSVGEVDVATGLVSLQALPANDTTTIEISARPAADDVVSRFNEILTIDLSKTNITADLDTSVSGSVSSLKDYNTFSRDR